MGATQEPGGCSCAVHFNVSHLISAQGYDDDKGLNFFPQARTCLKPAQSKKAMLQSAEDHPEPQILVILFYTLMAHLGKNPNLLTFYYSLMGPHLITCFPYRTPRYVFQGTPH